MEIFPSKFSENATLTSFCKDLFLFWKHFISQIFRNIFGEVTQPFIQRFAITQQLLSFWGFSPKRFVSLNHLQQPSRNLFSGTVLQIDGKYCWNYSDFLCAKIVTTILNIFLQNLHSRNKKVITIFIRNEKSHIKYLDIDFRINLVWQTKDIFQVYFVTFCISVSRVAFAKSGFVHSKIIVSRNFNFCDISSFSYSDKKKLNPKMDFRGKIIIWAMTKTGYSLR